VDQQQRTQAGSRGELAALLAGLPAILAGDAATGKGRRVREAALRAGAAELLSIIKEAFVVKARGGTDEAGITWAPLSPETVAYGRRHPGLNARRSRAAKKGRAGRPLLTDAQDRVWRAVYASTLARLQRGGSRGSDASSQAAGAAWAVVKAMGGKTILGEYGGEKVEIGRDTGRLLASLSPESRDDLLEIDGASVSVGSNVEYAAHFHRRRPLWPESLPEAWQERVAEVMAQAIMAALAEEVK